MTRLLLLTLTAGILSPAISISYQNDDFPKVVNRAAKEIAETTGLNLIKQT